MSEQTTTEKNDICELVRKAESDYISGVTTISKYVQVSQKDTLDRIDAYLNSKHLTGDKDSQGREKPFFNIVTAAVNIWYRATDLDRKNIKTKATKSSHYLLTFFATALLQQWMRKEAFGKFLNKWGRSLAKYGSSVTKWVEKDGKLHANVIPWSRIICDTIDFAQNPVIEKLQLTPSQLRKNKDYDQEMVEKLIDAQTSRTNLDREHKDNKSNYIELYEVHGEFPKSYKTGKEEDEDEYRQQMHVISFVERKDKATFDDFTLFSGFEEKSPYLLTHLMEEDDQTLSIGAVQNLFEAQWMVNHSNKNVKDVLDFISKMVYQTSDGNFVGQNALNSLMVGDILVHAPNQPLTQLAQNVDIGSHQSFQSQWQSLGSQINGISEAMLGKNAPAGSAWRQTEALLQESHSLFEVMTENKGLYVEEMLREFIIPHLKKQMDTNEEIAAILEGYNLDQIDSLYIPAQAVKRYNERAKEAILNGQQAPQFDPKQAESEVRAELNKLGNTRFLKPSEIPTKTWKEALKDFEWEIEIDITGEQKDRQAVMETLNTALKIISSTPPERLADPNFKLVFNKILEETAVISPIEIAALPPTSPPAPVNKVSESISYKDLPPDGQVQMAAQAGIKIAPPAPQLEPIKQKA